MSDKMQVADTSTRKRKASSFLTNDDNVLGEVRHDFESGVNETPEGFDMTYGKILAKISDVPSGDVYADCTDSKIMVQFMMRAIRSHSNLHAGNLSS